jgi:hypothetical protein
MTRKSRFCIFIKLIWNDLKPEPWWQPFALCGLVLATVVVVLLPAFWIGGLAFLLTSYTLERSMACGAAIYTSLIGGGFLVAIPFSYLRTKWREAEGVIDGN